MINDAISEALDITPLPETVLLEIEESIKWVMKTTDSNASGEKNSFYGKKHAEEARKMISEKQIGNKKRLGKRHSEDTKSKISESTINRFKNYEERNRISKTLKGRKLSEETKSKMSIARKGIKKSEEHIKKIRESNINSEKIECMHCGMKMNRGSHNRWHGDNCRYRNG